MLERITEVNWIYNVVHLRSNSCPAASTSLLILRVELVIQTCFRWHLQFPLSCHFRVWIVPLFLALESVIFFNGDYIIVVWKKMRSYGFPPKQLVVSTYGLWGRSCLHSCGYNWPLMFWPFFCCSGSAAIQRWKKQLLSWGH